MSYSSTVNGIAVTSNVDPNVSQPSGSNYKHDITFTTPFINELAAGGLNLVEYIDPQVIATQFAQKGHTISNVKITAQGSNVVRIAYTANSPTIVEAIVIIIGIIMVFTLPVIGGILGGILIFLGAAGLVIGAILTTVTDASKNTLVEFLIYGTAAVAVIGIVFVGYGMLKSGKTTEYAVSASQHTAKLAGKTMVIMGA